MNDLVLRGSLTAKRGFANEKEVAERFNNWKDDDFAKQWLTIMSYDIKEIEYVHAEVLSGEKSDINVQISIKLKKTLGVENIQVKLVSNEKGFNQIDKRWLKNYNLLWNIPDNIYLLLQYFTGEKLPYKSDTKDKRRMFLHEFENENSAELIEWFKNNKTLIISDVIKGRGEFSAEWVLVIQKLGENVNWILKNINEVLNFYSQGDVVVSPRGSINIGRITVQRKGGDNGRESANMLQFKLDPMKLFDL